MLSKDWFNRLKSYDGFPRLRYAELHLTDKCNLNCYFCNQKIYRFGGKSELETDVILRVLKRMREIGLDGVRLSGGGEPTLHPDFDTVIQYLVANDLVLWDLTTNALALSAEVLSTMSRLCWLSTTISIAAPDAEKWALVTGGKKPDFKRVIDNIREIVRLKKANPRKLPQTGLKYGIDRYTYEHLVEAYELACDLKVDNVLFTAYNVIEYEQEVLDSADRIIKQLKAIDMENRRTGRISHVRYSLGDLMLNDALSRELSSGENEGNDGGAICHDDYANDCFMPWYGTMIRADGEVKTCCAGCDLVGSLGNINNMDIKDIWYGSSYGELRSAFEKAIFESGCKEEPVALLRASKCIGGTDAEKGCPLKIGREILEEVYAGE